MNNISGKPRINYKTAALDIFINLRSLIILVLLGVLFSILSPYFLQARNFANIGTQIAAIAIGAFGMTFIITTAGIDLSVGSILALTSIFTGIFLSTYGWGLVPTIIVILVAGALMGLVNGVGVVYLRIEPLLMTLATMFIYRGISLLLTGGRPVPINSETFKIIFAEGSVIGIPSPVIITAVLLLFCWFLFSKTIFGYNIRAVGGNPEAARVAGINISVTKMIAYVFMGIMAAAAGFIISGRLAHGIPTIGETFALDTIAAVILGGTALAGGRGTIMGTIVGAMIMGVLNNGMTLLGAQYYTELIVKGIVICVAVVIDNFTRRK
ncbi:MAG: ABC transporter permease [Actinobacteria bacterium]|nr:ABC transporter permease [Actinomycetota bacterium]